MIVQALRKSLETADVAVFDSIIKTCSEAASKGAIQAFVEGSLICDQAQEDRIVKMLNDEGLWMHLATSVNGCTDSYRVGGWA